MSQCSLVVSLSECKVMWQTSHASHAGSVSAASLCTLALDAGFRRDAVGELHKDLGVVVLLVPEALQVATVAQQVHGQTEAQHAQHQQAHVHLSARKT